jgi:formylglycine-generating enzyme required for sulfatase activity
VLILVPSALAVMGACADVLGIHDPDVVSDGGAVGPEADAQGFDAPLDTTIDVATGDAEAEADASGPPSCQVPGDGRTNCGVTGTESCCTSISVPCGPNFLRDYDGTDEGSDAGNPANVTTFNLDEYEVTVGRFRQFVTAWDNGIAIDAGAGKHVALNLGSGLATGTGFESGWDPRYAIGIPNSSAGWENELGPCPGVKSWDDNEDKKPISCATWYEAYAFCIWDGGYLPSEAEWDCAAQGGRQSDAGQRVYPWSAPPDSGLIDCDYANYLGGVDGGACSEAGPSDVGSYSPLGDGRWGHADLAGNLWEWTLDWYSPTYINPCNDCANVGDAALPDASRVLRGGGFASPSSSLRAVRRYSPPDLNGQAGYGFRCARPND